jgi:hypothetical protein
MLVAVVERFISAFHENLAPLKKTGGGKTSQGAENDFLEKRSLHRSLKQHERCHLAWSERDPVSCSCSCSCSCSRSMRKRFFDYEHDYERAHESYQKPHCCVPMIQSPSRPLVTAWARTHEARLRVR